MNRNKIIIIVISVLALILVGVVVYLLLTVTTQKQQLEEAQVTNQQLQDNLTMANELAELNAQFEQHENEAIRLENDTILAKYNAAKARVEELIAELNSQKVKSAEQIQKLRDEIATLRNLLRHYIAQVDSLGRENAALREENTQVTSTEFNCSKSCSIIYVSVEIICQTETDAISDGNYQQKVPHCILRD